MTRRRIDHADVERAAWREFLVEMTAAGIVILGLLVSAVALRGCVGEAEAQREPDHVVLARLTVHEAGWDSPADASLIHDVLAGIVERDGVSYARAAELASPRLARCAVRRRWVCGLAEDGRRPAGWRGASWDAHRPRWMALLEHARRVVAGEVESPCAEPPRVWGAPWFVRDRVARGSRWVDARCTGTANVGGRWL